ncbi:hypothetical protein YPCBV1_00013 [Chromohalobacter phage YPCBV-1]|nr:hypothetical protein YPCBV1_00013 [Chromohalobacter phage YPCBV-1]
MATQQPTAEQWKQIEADVMRLYHAVWLDCDGYLVCLTLERIGKLRLGIVVYVDGQMKMEWLALKDGPSDVGRRFLQQLTRSVWRGKDKRAAKRAFGKKEAERTVSYRRPWWESPTSLRRHLVANNEVIRLLDADEARERLKALDEVAS